VKSYLIQRFQHIKWIPECVHYPLICWKTKLLSLYTLCRGYRSGSPTTVQAWQPCPLWEPSASHHILLQTGDLLCFVFIVCLLCFSVNCVFYVFLQYFDTVGLVFWPVKTNARITYTVLVETLNHTQSINQSISHVHCAVTVIRHINGAAISLRHCRQMPMAYDLEGAYKRWLQFENVSYTHLHAVLRKIEIGATRCQIFMHQIWFTLWLLHQTPLGAYSAPPDLLAVFEGLTFKERGEER